MLRGLDWSTAAAVAVTTFAIILGTTGLAQQAYILMVE